MFAKGTWIFLLPLQMTYLETGGSGGAGVGGPVQTSCPAPAGHPPLRPLLGRAPTHHVFDQQVSRGEGNGVGGRRDGEHEGIGAADRAGDHQIQGVHSQADGLVRVQGDTTTGKQKPPQQMEMVESHNSRQRQKETR